MNDQRSGPLWGGPGAVTAALALIFFPLVGMYLVATAMGIDEIALLGVVMSLFVAWTALKVRGSGWGELGMRRGFNRRRTFVLGAVSALGLLVVTSVVSTLLVNLTGWTPDISKFDAVRGDVGMLLGGLVVVWTTAAFGEEMLFRGIMLNSFFDLASGGKGTGRGAWALALIATSIIFGAAHAYQGIAGSILTGVVGLGFGLVYLWTGRNMWVAILAHGIYDTVGFVLVFLSWDKVLAPSLLLGLF